LPVVTANHFIILLGFTLQYRMSEQIRISFASYAVAHVIDSKTQQSLYVVLVEKERKPWMERLGLMGWWREMRAWAILELPKIIKWYTLEPNRAKDFRNTWIYDSVKQAHEMVAYIQQKCVTDPSFWENAYDTIIREFDEEFIWEFTEKHWILPVYSQREVDIFKPSLGHLWHTMVEVKKWEVLNIFRKDFFEYEMTELQYNRGILSWCYIPLPLELNNTLDPKWFDTSYYTFDEEKYLLGDNIVRSFWSFVDLMQKNWKNLATRRQLSLLEVT
jgi:hypothetical protein